MTNWENSNICSCLAWWHFRAPTSNRLLFTLRSKSNGNFAFTFIKSTLPHRDFPLSPSTLRDERMRRAFKGKFWRPFTFLTSVPQPGPGPTPDHGSLSSFQPLSPSAPQQKMCPQAADFSTTTTTLPFPGHVLKAPWSLSPGTIKLEGTHSLSLIESAGVCSRPSCGDT